MSPLSSTTIHVCQSSTCRSKGSEAILLEIEELASLACIDDNTNTWVVDVEPVGCLGYCSRGPAVAVVSPVKCQHGSVGGGRRRTKKTETTIHVQINAFEKSAKVVEEASKQKLDLQNLPPGTERRLSTMRLKRAKEYALNKFQWNRALQYLLQEGNFDRSELVSILGRAGYPSNASFPITTMPTSSIHGYVPWKLDTVQIVSSHSAIFKLSTKDLNRGTPHPRGGGKMASPVTWHVTMLGEVELEDEGPLPWIERDYTPISSALEWERGRVEILIKIYDTGRLTS